MVQINKQDSKSIDFSIMPTLECNLRCEFCMYDCSPVKYQKIDLYDLENFLKTIPDDLINSYGLYGGEPSINILLYIKVINLLPKDKPKFIITNGSWTKDPGITWLFINFVLEYNLTCFISSTPQHKVYQDTSFLKKITKRSLWKMLKRRPSRFIIKEDDTKEKLLPMGRNKTKDWNCTKKCVWNESPTRFAVMPNGDIIFQSCDGVYPIVGNMNNHFNLKEYSKQIVRCQEENA